MPAWMLPWREEIELGVTLATAGFGVFMQVQMHKSALAKEKAANDDGAGQPAQADLSRAA